MSNLPQIHDWFQGLLTSGQWVFLWIAAFIVIVVVGIIQSIRKDNGDLFVFSLYAATLLPVFAWVACMALGHFISFMIFLWFGDNR